VAGGWRKLHDFITFTFIRVIGSERVRWVVHVVHMEEMRKNAIFGLENLKERDHS
jgi:hypothetical protein